ncbi:MAG: hypothetical protein Q9224_006188 [Gallowayella concinna]
MYRSEREARLLEVIGLAVKRKKERHAGMGQLENMKNRPMILIDDQDPYRLSKANVNLPNGFSRIYGSHTARRIWNGLKSPSTQASFIPHSHQGYRPHIIAASLHSGAKLSSKTQASDPAGLPHLNATSEVHQISVGHKAATQREAVAMGLVLFSNPELLVIIQKHAVEKGDVLAVARVAGIMAVKSTSSLIPLAHNNVAVEGCTVNLSFVEAKEEYKEASTAGTGGRRSCGGVRIMVTCESTGKTGVEMEAMCGVMGAALTVVDMCKGLDKGITIENVKVVGKKGGKSGDWGIFAEQETTSQ